MPVVLSKKGTDRIPSITPAGRFSRKEERCEDLKFIIQQQRAFYH